MHNRNLFSRFALTAMLAGSIAMAGQSRAANDFEALLAEVDFGAAAAAVEEAAAPSSSDVSEVLPQATELATTPAAETLTMPAESEPLPAPPIADPIPADSVAAPAAAPCASACCNQCGKNCGKKCRLTGLKHRDFVQEGFCQPYMPPQLPTSTFYQYWRSNACNVNVWNGFKNRCHPHIDLSLNKKQSCGCDAGGCASGCSTGDCGPMPAEWSDSQ